MKIKSPLFFAFATMILLVGACKDDNDIHIPELPEVITNNAVRITADSAVLSAIIKSEGQSPIVDYGFCWGHYQNPSINDSNSSSASIAGPFVYQLSGLLSHSAYYVRAYARNNFGTSYGNQIELLTKSKIGDPGPSGGMIFYLDGNGGGLEVARFTTDNFGDWGCPTTLISGTTTEFGSGYPNTNLIVNGCPQIVAAAKLCYDLTLNGNTEWYLPSKDELNLIYTSGIFYLNPEVYWCSTEESAATAWSQHMGTGVQSVSSKSNIHKVRAISAF